MKNGMARVYVGDIGVINTEKYIHHEEINIAEIDLESLTLREMCNIALAIGIDVRVLIGVDTCIEHYGMVKLEDNKMPDGFDLFNHCKYCKNCWMLFRLKKVV